MAAPASHLALDHHPKAPREGLAVSRATATRLLLLPLAMAPLLGGCHHYAPIAAEGLSPGMEVRATVTPQQAEALSGELRRTDRTVLEGVFLRHGQGELVIEVPAVSDLRGGRIETIPQRITLSQGEIVALERRELDRRRTFLLAGTGTVLAGAILVGLFGERGGS